MENAYEGHIHSKISQSTAYMRNVIVMIICMLEHGLIGSEWEGFPRAMAEICRCVGTGEAWRECNTAECDSVSKHGHCSQACAVLILASAETSRLESKTNCLWPSSQACDCIVSLYALPTFDLPPSHSYDSTHIALMLAV